MDTVCWEFPSLRRKYVPRPPSDTRIRFFHAFISFFYCLHSPKPLHAFSFGDETAREGAHRPYCSTRICISRGCGTSLHAPAWFSSAVTPFLIHSTDVKVCEHPGTEQGMRGESSDLGEEEEGFDGLGGAWTVFMWFLNSSMLEAMNEQSGTLQMQVASLWTFS